MLKNISFKLLKVACLCLLLSTSSVSSAQISKEILNQKQALLDSLFSHFGVDEPGYVLKVTMDGKTLYKKIKGVSDLEQKSSITEETIFEAGSISKQVTAAAVLILVKKFGLKLNEDIRKYFPEMPSYGSVITIQQLLNHTSGLKDWGHIAAMSGIPRHSYTYTQQAALSIMFRQKSLNFTPGTNYAYSNSNYTLLASLVEKVTKMNLLQFTQKELFEPLGMSHTSWRNNYKDVVGNRAQAYQAAGKTYQLYMPFENVVGHGGLLTTVDDLDKWNNRFLLKEGFLSEIFKQQIITQTLPGGFAMQYGNGIFAKSFNGYMELSHSGSTAGYNAWAAYYPESKISISLLSNSSKLNAEWYGNQIRTIIFGAKADAKPNTENTFTPAKSSIKALDGLYKNLDGVDFIDLSYKGDNLYLTVTGGKFNFKSDTEISLGDLEIQFKSNDLFNLKNSARGSDKLYQYKRVERIDQEEAKKMLSIYEGKYESEEAGVLYDIKSEKGVLTISFGIGNTKMSLYPIAKDVFVIGSILIVFQRDGLGNLTGFEVSTERATKVPFVKKM